MKDSYKRERLCLGQILGNAVEVTQNAPSCRSVLVANDFSNPLGIAGDHDQVATLGALGIDRDQGVAVGGTVNQNRLNDYQPPTFQALMLGRCVGRSENSCRLHNCYRLAAPPTTFKSSIMLQRRSRVNVNGVVTPSPVGPAIENDK